MFLADQKQANSWKAKDSNTASINSWRIKDTNQSAHMSGWRGKDSNSQSPNINSLRGNDSNSQPNSAFVVWNNNADNIDRRSSHQVLQNYPASTNVKQLESRLSGPPMNLPRETGPPINLPKETGSSILPKESGPPVNLSKSNVSRKKDQKQGLSEFQAIWNELHQLGVSIFFVYIKKRVSTKFYKFYKILSFIKFVFFFRKICMVQKMKNFLNRSLVIRQIL